MNTQPSWRSGPIPITDDTVVEVIASAQGVVIEQNGEAWLHDLHLNPKHARAIAQALLDGAQQAVNAQGGAG